MTGVVQMTGKLDASAKTPTLGELVVPNSLEDPAPARAAHASSVFGRQVHSETSMRRLVVLALPILLPMLSQNLRLLVDTALIGRLGTDILAAQGILGFLALLLMAPLAAQGSSVQGLVARALGRSQEDVAHSVLRAAVGLAVFGGTAYASLLFLSAPLLTGVLHSTPAVEAASLGYLQPILLSAPVVGLTSAFYGYWLARGRPRINLVIELSMQLSNAALAYVLVFGKLGAPALGLPGAGVALATSSLIGSLMHLAAFRRLWLIGGPVAWLKSLQIEAALVVQSWNNLRTTIQNGLAIFCLYFISQQIGMLALAGFTVLIRFSTLLIYPATALGLAAASLAGQAIGRGEPDVADSWARRALMAAAIGSGALGIPFWVAPYEITLAITDSADVAAVATWPLRLMGAMSVFAGAASALSALLSATGGARRARRMNFVSQWLLLVPLAAVVGPVLGWGLFAISVVQSGARTLLALLLWREWSTWRRLGFHVQAG